MCNDSNGNLIGYTGATGENLVIPETFHFDTETDGYAAGAYKVTSIGVGAFQDCTSLRSITFNGTREQWNSVAKGGGWNNNTGNYTIHCTDGDIAKS